MLTAAQKEKIRVGQAGLGALNAMERQQILYSCVGNLGLTMIKTSDDLKRIRGVRTLRELKGLGLKEARMVVEYLLFTHGLLYLEPTGYYRFKSVTTESDYDFLTLVTEYNKQRFETKFSVTEKIDGSVPSSMQKVSDIMKAAEEAAAALTKSESMKVEDLIMGGMDEPDIDAAFKWLHKNTGHSTLNCRLAVWHHAGQLGVAGVDSKTYLWVPLSGTFCIKRRNYTPACECKKQKRAEKSEAAYELLGPTDRAILLQAILKGEVRPDVTGGAKELKNILIPEQAAEAAWYCLYLEGWAELSDTGHWAVCNIEGYREYRANKIEKPDLKRQRIDRCSRAYSQHIDHEASVKLFELLCEGAEYPGVSAARKWIKKNIQVDHTTATDIAWYRAYLDGWAQLSVRGLWEWKNLESFKSYVREVRAAKKHANKCFERTASQVQTVATEQSTTRRKATTMELQKIATAMHNATPKDKRGLWGVGLESWDNPSRYRQGLLKKAEKAAEITDPEKVVKILELL